MTDQQPSAKPSSPPPAYTEIEIAGPPPPQLQSHQTSSPYNPHAALSSPSQFPSHTGYGPTSIVAQQQAALIPYYDPRSPHAIAQAGSRARQRFLSAIAWAICILFLAGFIMGWEIQVGMHGKWIVRRILGGQETWKDQ